MKMVYRKTLIFAVLAMCIGVILGAFGAHALKDLLAKHAENPAESLTIWKTGVFYQLTHGLSIIGTIILGRTLLPHASLQLPLTLFIIGICCFSGSLYLLVINDITEISILNKIMGPITPLGGTILVFGWLLLLLKIMKHYRS